MLCTIKNIVHNKIPITKTQEEEVIIEKIMMYFSTKKLSIAMKFTSSKLGGRDGNVSIKIWNQYKLFTIQ